MPRSLGGLQAALGRLGMDISRSGIEKGWQGQVGLPFPYKDVTVTSAQMLALNATPISIIPAPGAGKVNILIGALLFLDFNSAAYAGIAAGEDLDFNYTDGSGVTVASVEATGFLDQTNDEHRYVYPLAAAEIEPAANAAIVLHMSSGEIITGDSPLKVRAFYNQVDLLT